MPTKNVVTLSVPSEVTREARKRAIDDDTSMSAVVTALLRMWLAGEIELPAPEPKEKKGGKHKTK